MIYFYHDYTWQVQKLKQRWKAEDASDVAIQTYM